MLSRAVRAALAAGETAVMTTDTEFITVADAALAASLFHDGKLLIPDLKRELQSLNVPVRI